MENVATCEAPKQKMAEYKPVLTPEIVKKYICPSATDSEIYFFLELCKAQNLNPFLREAYLIKYGTDPATIVTGKETFLKRAETIENYRGFKAGVIVLSDKTVAYREGSFIVPGEKILGGWAEVYRCDRDAPIRIEVGFDEYAGRKKDGTLNRIWSDKPATMIRKVALVQALRETFPKEFGGMYSPEEINTINAELPEYDTKKEQTPQYRTEKPTMTPPQSKTDGVITQKQAGRFYALAKATGYSDDEIREYMKDYLGISTTKEMPVSMYEIACEWAQTPRTREPGDDEA